MQSKTQSCEKSIRSKLNDQNGNQDLNKLDKKSQQYLSQKFQLLYSEDKKLRDKRQEMIQQNVRVKQEKEIVGCTFKPEINNNSEYHTTKQPFLQREQNWKRNVEKKITEKREQMSKKQIDGITFMPKITPGLKTKSKKMIKTGYSTKINFTQKKSYRAIHNQRKKFQEIAKNTMVQPFPHRKILSAEEINSQINNQQLNPENNHEGQVKGLQTLINQQTKIQQNQPQQAVKNEKDEQEKKENETPLEAVQGTKDKDIKEEELKQQQVQKLVQKEVLKEVQKKQQKEELKEEQKEEQKKEQKEQQKEEQKNKDIKDVVDQQEEVEEHKQININHQYQNSNQFDKLNQVEPPIQQQGQTVNQ